MGSATGTVIWTGRSGSCFTAPSTGVAYVHHSTSVCATTTNTTARTITFVAQTCNTSFSSPWTENFDGLGATASGTSNALLPCGWSKSHGDWATSNAGSNTYNDPRSASYYLTNAYTATNETVFTRGFSLTAGISYTFEFYFAGDGLSGWTGDVISNTQQTVAGATTMGASFIASATTSTSAYSLVSRTFTPSSNGIYYFGVRINATSNPWYLGFDDFTLYTTPTCSSIPSSLTSSLTSNTTASLSWAAASPAPGSGYEIYYSTSSTAPIAGTAATTTTAAGVVTKNITGLTANATYYWWVRSNCNGTDKGSWVSGGTFFTGYCQPTNTSSGDYISSFSTSGGTLNINNSGTGTAALENFTAQTVSQFATGSVSFSGAYVGGSAGFSIWVDWNNNLVFDASERMFNASATAASWTGSFVVRDCHRV
jgi:hypothetical protein